MEKHAGYCSWLVDHSGGGILWRVRCSSDGQESHPFPEAFGQSGAGYLGHLRLGPASVVHCGELRGDRVGVGKGEFSSALLRRVVGGVARSESPTRGGALA